MLQLPIYYILEWEVSIGMRAMREKLNIFMLQLDLLHIRIGNLDWCKRGHCKNKAREIDCRCCREVDEMLIASAKIHECEGSISPCSFYG